MVKPFAIHWDSPEIDAAMEPLLQFLESMVRGREDKIPMRKISKMYGVTFKDCELWLMIHGVQCYLNDKTKTDWFFHGTADRLSEPYGPRLNAIFYNVITKQ